MTVLRRIVAAILLASLLTCAFACSRAEVSLKDSDTDYTPDTVVVMARSIPTPSTHGKPVSEAADLRHDALVELRAMEGEGAQVADLLTAQFPSPARSVPYYVESATFEGSPAWIIVEVWGSEDGTLDQTRVWVFDRENEQVLLTAAVN